VRQVSLSTCRLCSVNTAARNPVPSSHKCFPLRYSHSPAEVIDVRDAEALGRIIAVLAQGW